MDLPVSTDRKLAFDTFMVARGVEQVVLDLYWVGKPNATYQDVADDFALFLGG
jgi:hypothetical protein